MRCRVNMVDCLLLYRITNRSLAVWILIWLNPVIIFTVGFHGQFESLSLLTLLVAIFLHRQGRLSDVGLLLLGTTAVVLKQNIVFAVWMAFFLLVWFVSAILQRETRQPVPAAFQPE